MSVLVIDLDSLKRGSCLKKGDIEAMELGLEGERRFGFSGPLRLDVRVSTTDQLSFHITGALVYTAQGDCRRCLKKITAPVESELRGMYAFPEALGRLSISEQERQEQGIFPLLNNDREIDLAALVREVIVLEYPHFFQCAEDCRGLCPRCGNALEVDKCGCRDELMDPRWSKLLDLKNKK
jgi:DUF177 domain-containing protein